MGTEAGGFLSLVEKTKEAPISWLFLLCEVVGEVTEEGPRKGSRSET